MLILIYGIWPQTGKYTHAHGQCSPASVGLTQARPNHHSANLQVSKHTNLRYNTAILCHYVNKQKKIEVLVILHCQIPYIGKISLLKKFCGWDKLWKFNTGKINLRIDRWSMNRLARKSTPPEVNVWSTTTASDPWFSWYLVNTRNSPGTRPYVIVNR